MERSSDHGSLHVLEAMLIAFVLVGSAYAVSTLSRSSMENVRPREGLERLGSDALIVLEGLSDERGSFLETSILEALHCARDAVPSEQDCDGARPANLTLKMQSYLPVGAGYSLQLGNGARNRVVYQTGSPAGEASSSSITYAPQWNTTFIVPELSCYPSTSAANVTMLPLLRARTGDVAALNVSYGGATEVEAEKAAKGWWNATLPAAGRPATAILAANASGRAASFNGSTSLGTCDLSGAESAVVAALRTVTFEADHASVALGGSTTFRAGLAPLTGVGSVVLGSAEVKVYEPVTARAANDTWLLAARLPLPGGETAAVEWTPPADAFYGAHVAVLRVNLTVGSQPVVAHRVAVVDVALPTGQVPLDPLYRAHLLTWMPDWR